MSTVGCSCVLIVRPNNILIAVVVIITFFAILAGATVLCLSFDTAPVGLAILTSC